MLDSVGKIFSVLGILLLILLIVFLVVLLLVLFFPITYKVSGEKSSEKAYIQLKVDWLFGFFRVRGAYPEPGKLKAKLLWYTLYDSSNPKKEPKNDGKITTEKGNAEKPESKNTGDTEKPEAENEKEAGKQDTADAENTEKCVEAENSEGLQDARSGPDTEQEGFFQGKISKIKYTIQAIYDKIKVLGVFGEEETKELISHICFRIGKIWKNIRPRHIRAQILFGTGAPDTTGYLFAIYGMLSPNLGPTVSVTPDFTQTVFEGEGSLKGHVTVFVLLIQAIKVLLDKRLYLLIDKFKAGRKE